MIKPLISMIAAVARNGVIGRENDLPWHMSTDLKRFKAMTMGKPLIIGRKNLESFPRLLPGRPHVVITRDTTYAREGVHVVHSFDEAISTASDLADETGADEICIAGGGEIYRLGMPVADVLHITHVEADIAGDTTFPEIDPAVWDAVEVGRMESGEKDDHSARFVTYTRRK
ncbi:dihydrofolate reductase [Rhizobium sp. C4]|uniref:dihydrofolate reductase n=1 Tax=Rhizobium sp. C4 TaxID=1349800 RepID=UPI001E36D31B|nr:dihydrofolate reductase [Rhizobium sp. C4]MCD2173178.1 dihydrofolate reductase [Rhizobium sp. C4]